MSLDKIIVVILIVLALIGMAYLNWSGKSKKN